MHESRFEGILKYRGWIEEKRRRELAEIKQSLKEEEATKAFRKKLRSDSLEDLRQKQMKGLPISEVLLYEAFIHRLSTQLKGQERKIKQMRVKLSEKLEALMSASRDKEMIVRLKEKELEERSMEELRREQRFVDEIGIGQYNRKKERNKRGLIHE